MNIWLFRVFGITVTLHWSWFLVAIYQVKIRAAEYGGSLFWPAAEYIALFAIVLLHEFGHSLACRQTGGYASDILLWPLGGVAFVSPPHRPGAQLWSIAAGPLVNVVLFVPLTPLKVFGAEFFPPAAQNFVFSVWAMNLILLMFNLLPIYPLDGGQILRSLLWFVMGPVRSLKVALFIGILGGAAMMGYALWSESIWFGVLALFVLMQCARSYAMVRQM